AMKENPSVEWRVFKTREKLVEDFARQWAERMTSRAGDGLVALSGGRLAEPLFAAMAAQLHSGAKPASRMHFFWADERCVPPDHPDSNYRLAQRFLLAPLAVEEDRIHRIRGERDSVQAAREAEEELLRVAGRLGRDTSALDFVWLGMGEDGHVASLFPANQIQDLANPRLFYAVVGPKPPPIRVTLGYSAIAAAGEVWITVVGPEKREALRRSLLPDGDTPLASVLRQRSRARIFATTDSLDPEIISNSLHE
ncbi:MAG TPA: 6-phosphogluconolactonase, partial [Candidatus Paceibacterota bacterium]|nr:6-phosphogluconolactonase [Candidatus Paceibacterota bacterium]